MKKSFLIALTAFFSFMTKEAYSVSLTNPAYMPPKGTTFFETTLEYNQTKYDRVATSSKEVTKVETEANRVKESVRYGIQDNLSVDLGLEYSVNELESRSPSGILSEYEYQGFENPEFSLKWKPIRGDNYGAGVVFTSVFDMFESNETVSNYRNGTVANGRNEFGLSLFYGKIFEKFTIVPIANVKYLGKAKTNKIQANGDKNSIEDNKHYRYCFAIKTEFLVTNKFSTNVDFGYTVTTKRTVRDKTQSSEWDRSDGDVMVGKVQLNYAINNSLYLSTYYQYQVSDDTVFDFADPTSDYEYKNTESQSGGIKLVTKF